MALREVWHTYITIHHKFLKYQVPVPCLSNDIDCDQVCNVGAYQEVLCPLFTEEMVEQVKRKQIFVKIEIS